MGRFAAAGPPRPCFSRSYACVLPSSLARALPCALASSASPPVSVFGTVRRALSLMRSFPAPESPRFPRPWPRSLCARLGPFSPALLGSRLRRGKPTPRRGSPRASRRRRRGGGRNVDRLPIGCGLRPRLRGRLTPGQTDLTLETSGFRRRGIPPLFTLLMPAFSLAQRPRGLPPPLRPRRNAPLPRAVEYRLAKLRRRA